MGFDEVFMKFLDKLVKSIGDIIKGENSKIADNLEKLNTTYNDDIKQMMKKTAELETSVQTKATEIEHLQEQVVKLEKEKTALSKKCDDLENIFSPLLDAFNLYKKIEDNTELENVLSGDNPIYLFAKAMDDKGLIKIHQNVKHNMKENKNNDDTKRIKEILDMYLKVSNYKIFLPEIGANFNRDEHFCGDKTSGKIKEVIFYGIKDDNGQVLEKAWVNLG